jgi:hypothetical protein
LIVLKDFALVVFLQVIGENVGVHQSSSGLAKDIQSLGQELNLDPRDALILHFHHLLFG